MCLFQGAEWRREKLNELLAKEQAITEHLTSTSSEASTDVSKQGDLLYNILCVLMPSVYVHTYVSGCV